MVPSSRACSGWALQRQKQAHIHPISYVRGHCSRMDAAQLAGWSERQEAYTTRQASPATATRISLFTIHHMTTVR